MNRIIVISFALAFLVVAITAHRAAGDDFGSGANTFTIDFVTIADPGNPADETGGPNPAGSVSYIYRISTFEISEDIINKANAEAGLGIGQSNRGPDKPSTRVSWFDAARFVNWLNTSKGHPPAYKFNGGTFELWGPSDPGYDPENLYRNRRARYVLPSAHEWYKAAYYDPSAAGYFDYPTGSDAAPSPVASGTTSGTAVFDQPFLQGPADVSKAGGPSPWGTVGQGGNVYEWEESSQFLNNSHPDERRGFRGGSWEFGVIDLSSSWRLDGHPADTIPEVGFRVASILYREGDLDCNEQIDAGDISAFVLALINSTSYEAMHPNCSPNLADVNHDGRLDGGDLQDFANLILTGES